MRKRIITAGAGATALALTAAIGAGSAAWAADITGETEVTLDFTTAGQVEVKVWAQNTSSVPAYGTAVIKAPDGAVEDYGPRLFQPGEIWTWTKTLKGYDCDDVAETAAATFGFEKLGTAPDWTSGVLTAPDPRVSVIGCDPSPTPSPTPLPSGTTSPTPTPTPSASTGPTGTPTPTATVTPTATPRPTASATATAVPASTTTKGGALAATGVETDAVLPLGIGAASALLIGAVLLVARRRRSA
ncbi:LPXTG cell wall anchor domain-containing protein [Microbacterium testaceum]|uniref:LPXTG cell wall anchor domain-containing protein n=1 Tax=Microbacterium testaceum TaxID=2033 RepID=UPI0022E1BCC9|nr:LPXTG cell wall anchor domain-containing protein [Microbacterium testaceum]